LLRWPEFGFGIRPAGQREESLGWRTRYVEVEHWRGGRDERAWPEFLEHGDRSEWPWKWSKDGPPKEATT
jgi:hypothetical protein